MTLPISTDGSARIVIAAGGTGGHVFPARALAQTLRQRGLTPAFVTDRRGIGFGDELVDVARYTLSAGGVSGRGLFGAVRGLIDLLVGLIQARRLLKRLAPSLAVGFGGYASLPPLVAASSLGVPVLIHESNAVLGRANRMLAGRASVIATAFEPTAKLARRHQGKLRRIGNPVRAQVIAARAEPYAAPGLEGPLQLLVFGGSQGAGVFARVVPAALSALAPAMRSGVKVVQQCRGDDLAAVRAAYLAAGIDAELAEFFGDMPARLARAQLVIARAGASTVAELTTVGRPAILVPFPYAIDDHQAANAQALARNGAAWTMREPDFTAEALAATIEQFLTTPSLLAVAAAKARAMGAPDATERLADLAERLIAERRVLGAAA